MVCSRSSSALVIGPHAKRRRTKSSNRKTMVIQITRPKLGFSRLAASVMLIGRLDLTYGLLRLGGRTARPATERRCPHLLRGKQDTDHEAEERHALDEGRRDNHRRTDVASGFRLTRRAFH